MVYEHEIMPDSTIRSFYEMQQEGDEVGIVHQIKDETGEKLHCVAKSVWRKHADAKGMAE